MRSTPPAVNVALGKVLVGALGGHIGSIAAMPFQEQVGGAPYVEIGY